MIASPEGFRATWVNPDVIDFAAIAHSTSTRRADFDTARRVGTVNADYYIAQQVAEDVLVYIRGLKLEDCRAAG